MHINTPYLLFLGDAPDPLAAKVAQGIVDWRPDNAIGQYRMPGCQADLGLPDLSIAEGLAVGARTLVIGVANRGGVIAEAWVTVMLEALEAGLDLAAGLHNRLSDVPQLSAAAARLGRDLHDVRHPRGGLSVASGVRRPGRRLLAVGTDCSCGKMYTTLAIEKEMRDRGMAADFRATGQTGILITGAGIAIDAVVADFISGAVEALAPENDPEHWDVIEGQGSLFHASFAGVSLGLIHGAQPDALVLCHEPTRTHMRGLPGVSLPDIGECMALNLKCAQLTNPGVKFTGISVNTAALDEAETKACLEGLEDQYQIPCVDPFRHGAGRLVDALA